MAIISFPKLTTHTRKNLFQTAKSGVLKTLINEARRHPAQTFFSEHQATTDVKALKSRLGNWALTLMLGNYFTYDR
jgi:hypothetical protein